MHTELGSGQVIGILEQVAHAASASVLEVTVCWSKVSKVTAQESGQASELLDRMAGELGRTVHGDASGRVHNRVLEGQAAKNQVPARYESGWSGDFAVPS